MPKLVLVAALALVSLTGCARLGIGPPTPTPTPPPAIGPDVAVTRIGQEVRVRMRVECADLPIRNGPTYLRPNCYYQGYFFRLVIPPEARATFIETVRGPPEVMLIDQVVDARGVVQANGEWAEIVVDSPSQLRIATGWLPPQVPTRVPGVGTQKTGR